ncbi:MAG: hypothetical protein KKF44_02855, partial [Nanoarchaeota archaeon]|nr:hypothetical protein [Nanoarchaeota archaeon]
MKITKLNVLLIIAVYMIGLVPLSVFAQNVDAGNRPVKVDAVQAKDSFTPVRTHIRNMGKVTYDTCVQRAKQNFPDADIAGIRTECKNLADKVEDAAIQGIMGNLKATAARLRAAQKNPGITDFLESVSDEDAEKFLHLSRAEQVKLFALSKEKINEKLKNLVVRTVKVRQLYQKRELAQEKIMQANEKFEKAKERYQNAKDRFKEAKDAFDAAVKNGDEEEAKEHAKEFLLKSADMIIESLNKVKEQAAGNDDLTEEEAQDIIDDMDEKIAEIEAAKAQVEAAETKEEIKEAGSLIIKDWNRIKYRLRLHAGRTISAKVQDVLKRSEQLEARLDSAIADLEEKGYDVSAVDDQVDEFSNLVDLARQKFNDAKDRLGEARDMADGDSTQEEADAADTKVEEAKALVNEAHRLLKDAHDMLKEIVRDIKTIDPSAEIDAESEDRKAS